MTSISIVTPWQAHLELADDYFEAVLPEMEEGDECIIVDNASTPPLAFGTVRSEENLGFARGSNLGLRHAKGDAVLFLNNDVEYRERGWLDKIRNAVAPGTLVGPVRYDRHADVDGSPFPYIDGWCLAGMRDDLLRLGGFDEELLEPSYYSDNLLCLEARAAGMSLLALSVGLHHKENRTAGGQFDPSVSRASLANGERYRTRVRELL